MVVVISVYAAFVFLFVNRKMSNFFDDQLRVDFDWASDMLHQAPDGDLKTYEETGQDDSPWLRVFDIRGDVIYETPEAKRNPIAGSDRMATVPDERIISVDYTKPPMRVMSGRALISGQPRIVQVAKRVSPIKNDLRQFLYLLLLGLPIEIVLSGLGGYALARRALAPVDRMAEQARQITVNRLKDRLPVDNPTDELGKLATVFNQVLTRLESSFDQMRRFTSDASHELRTPLTAIRSVGEVGLRGKRDEAGYREVIGSMLEEVDGLSRLVDRLLLLSRADSGDAVLSNEDINLSSLAEEVAAQLEVLAEEKQQSITVQEKGEPHWNGDRLVLRQALINLVDNAIKYTQAGGRITISVAHLAKNAVIDVIDNGPGIPAELQSRVFDRFFRVDKSRSRDHGGTGLGLAIAKTGVEVQGGTLSLEPSNGAGGSIFRISLPLPDR